MNPSLSSWPVALGTLGRRAKTFFSADSARCLLQHFESVLPDLIATGSSQIFVELYILFSFLPRSALNRDESARVVELLLSVWDLISVRYVRAGFNIRLLISSLSPCLGSRSAWFTFLVASSLVRISKNGVVWTQSQGQVLFTNIAISLDVASGAAKIDKPAHEHCPPLLRPLLSVVKKASAAQALGQLTAIVCSFNSSLLPLLKSLLGSLDSFYHPVNSGNWSDRLTTFLHQLISRVIRIKSNPNFPGAAALPNFVPMMLPLAIRVLFGRGAAQMFASTILRDLAYLEPHTVYEAIKSRTDAALVNPKSGLQLPSCITALGLIIIPVLAARKAGPLEDDEVSQELVNFAEALVPGIDPNDVAKTIATLRFYSAYFELFSIGQAGQPHEIQTRQVAHAVLERLIEYFRSQDAPSKNESLAERLVYRLVSRVANLIFANSSASDRVELLSKALDKFREMSILNFYREAGVIVQAAARVSAETIPTLLKSRLNDSAKLQILSRAVRLSGDYLLSLDVSQLTQLIRSALAKSAHGAAAATTTEDKADFGSALRLLKNLLKALTETYQLPNHFHLPSGGIGDPVLVSELPRRVRWFVPQSTHVEFAAKLIMEFGSPLVLESAPLLHGKELRHSLKALREIIKGGSLILPDSDATKSADNTLGVLEDDSDGTSSLRPLGAAIPLAAFEAAKSVAKFRESVAAHASVVGSRLVQSYSSDFKTLRAWSKLSGVVLCRFSIPSTRVKLMHNRLIMFSSYAKDPRYSRGLQRYRTSLAVADKALFLHSKRAARDLPEFDPVSHPMAYSQLMTLLKQVAELNADFFGASRVHLYEALRPRFWLHWPTLRSFISVLRDSSATEESVKNSVTFLKAHWAIQRVTRQTRNVDEFGRSFLDLSSRDYPKIQPSISALLAEFVANSRPLSFASGNGETYSRLFESLQTALCDSSSSTRLRVASLAMLAVSLPADASNLKAAPLALVVKAVWDNLFHSMPFVRVLARRVLVALLSLANLPADILLQTTELIGASDGRFTGLINLRDQLALEHESVGVVDEAEAAKSDRVSAQLQALGRVLQSDISEFLGSGNASLEERLRRNLIQYSSFWSPSRWSRVAATCSDSFVPEVETFSRLSALLMSVLFRHLDSADAASALSLALRSFSAATSPRSLHVSTGYILFGAAAVPALSSAVREALFNIWRTAPKAQAEHPWTFVTQYLLTTPFGAIEAAPLLQSAVKALEAPASSAADSERLHKLVLCIASERLSLVSQTTAAAVLESHRTNNLSPLPDASPSVRQAWATEFLLFSSQRSWTQSKIVYSGVAGFSAIASTVSASNEPREKLSFLELVDKALDYAESPSHPFNEAFPKILEATFQLQQDPSDEVKKRAIVVSTRLSLAVIASPAIVDSLVISAAANLAASSSWKLRSPILPLLQVFMFNHRFLASAQACDKLLNIVTSALGDSAPEVREAAKSTVSSILVTLDIVSDSTKMSELTAKFATPLRDALRAKKGSSSSSSTSNADSGRNIHSSILGLTALVETRPYEVPDWMPQTLDQLASAARLAAPHSDAARKSIAEFWRTHGDEFELYEHRFTSDQLQALRNHTASSYFA